MNKVLAIIIALGLLAVSGCPGLAQLAGNTYIFKSGPNAVDGGFGYAATVHSVQLYPVNTGPGQQWIWNGSTLKNVRTSQSGSAICGGKPCFLQEAIDSTATQGINGDTFTVAVFGSGCSIRNNRTGRFLQDAGGVGVTGLRFTSTATAFAVTVSSTGAAASCSSGPPNPPGPTPPNAVPYTINWKGKGGKGPNNATIFHAPGAMIVTKITATIDTALGSAGTIKVRKVSSKILHCDDPAGVDIMSGTVDANAASAFREVTVIPSTATLAPNDRLCVVTAGAGWVAPIDDAQGAITITAAITP